MTFSPDCVSPTQDDGNDCHGAITAIQVQPSGPAVVCAESGGDERRRRPPDDSRQLGAERGAAVADARAEQLGEERRLRAIHRGVREARTRRSAPATRAGVIRYRAAGTVDTPTRRSRMRRTDTPAVGQPIRTTRRRTGSRASSMPAPIRMPFSTVCCEPLHLLRRVRTNTL